MNNKIKLIMDVYNLSVSEFANKIGITTSGVSHIINGRNKPSSDVLLKILNEFPDIDSDWLMRDKIQMFRVNKIKNDISQKIDHDTQLTIPLDINNCRKENIENEIKELDINRPHENIIDEEDELNNQFRLNNDEQKKKSENTSVDIPIFKNSISAKSSITKVIIFYDDDTFVEYSKKRTE